MAAYVDVSYYLKPQFSLKFGSRIESVIRDFKANSSSLSEDFIEDSSQFKFLIDEQLENDSYKLIPHLSINIFQV